jgi:hypothetical protein
VAQTWLSIRVDLMEGHGEQYWPRPGRIFAAARRHTFKQLADAIDDAFARWDRSLAGVHSRRRQALVRSTFSDPARSHGRILSPPGAQSRTREAERGWSMMSE